MGMTNRRERRKMRKLGDCRPLVIVCAGPPDCDLEDDDAIAAANAGCPKCRRMLVNSDGSVDEYKVKAN